jgi:phage gpG-like protein
VFFQFTSTANLVVRDLNRLASAIPAGTRGLLERAVDEVVRPSVAANFEAGGRPPWDELAEATLERRERAGLGDRPLIASGAGMDAALDRSRWSISRSQAVYPGGGWSGPGAHIRFHQQGSEDGRLPARPFVQLQPEDECALDRVGLAWLDGRLREAGF